MPCRPNARPAGENTRNFLHVADVANAFEKILHAGVAGSIYNIGGTNEYSVLQVAKDLMRQATAGARATCEIFGI